MRYLILLKLLVFCLASNAQFNDTTNYYLNVTATGIINKTNDRDAYLLNNSFRFSTYKKRFSANAGFNYIYGEVNDNLSNRDLNTAVDYNIFSNTRRWYYWGLGLYEKSFSLKINDRFQAGAGAGYLIINAPKAVINISDGILYEHSEIINTEAVVQSNETVRNSFRLKFRFIIGSSVTIEGTDFLQHALEDPKDYIIRSNTNLSIKLRRWLSFTTGVTYNKLTATQRENLLINFGITAERYF